MLQLSNQLLVSANFAEGRDPLRIDEMMRRIAAEREVLLVEVDPNRHFNTTTVIFGGGARAVLQASFALTEAALAHLDCVNLDPPQPGILQPLSFIPLKSEQLDLAQQVAHEFCRTAAERYRLPMFQFGLPGGDRSRKYPNDFQPFLENKPEVLLETGDWRPDFGPERINPHVGIMISGARFFHLNLAVYLETDKIDLVEKWLDKRTGPETEEGHEVEAESSTKSPLQSANIFAEELTDERRVRLLCNIPDYTRLPLVDLFNEIDALAVDLGIELIGAELLGFTPAEPMIEAGKRQFSKLYGEMIDNDLRCMMLAVQKLKLNEINVFDLRRQVLEYRLNSGR